MPCGPHLIEAVASRLHVQFGARPIGIAADLDRIHGKVTTRAIRYAITELIKQGRAKRKGQQGPVYAVAPKETKCLA